ncbi:hypothetical protein GEMRC1_008368 [Eukaryota sp. GEM-RC1]
MPPKKSSKQPRDTAKLKEVLEDLAVSCIDNLEDDTVTSILPLLKNLQIAHWDYLDNKLKAFPNLPRYKFWPFAEEIQKYSPTVQAVISDWEEAKDVWGQYQGRVSRVKVVFINDEQTHFLTVRTQKSKSVDLPGGKINENEDPLVCAIRECQEEMSINAAPYLSYERYMKHHEKKGTIHHGFVGIGLPMTQVFTAETEGEIGGFVWEPIDKIEEIIGQKPAPSIQCMLVHTKNYLKSTLNLDLTKPQKTQKDPSKEVVPAKPSTPKRKFVKKEKKQHTPAVTSSSKMTFAEKSCCSTKLFFRSIRNSSSFLSEVSLIVLIIYFTNE